MIPSLLACAVATTCHSGHDAFWQEVQELLTPEQLKRFEQLSASAFPFLHDSIPIRRTEPILMPLHPVTTAFLLIEKTALTMTVENHLTSEQAKSLVRRLNLLPHRLASRITGWGQLNDNQQAALISFTDDFGIEWFGSQKFPRLTATLQRGLQINRNELLAIPAVMLDEGSNIKPETVLLRKAEGDLWNDSSGSFLPRGCTTPAAGAGPRGGAPPRRHRRRRWRGAPGEAQKKSPLDRAATKQVMDQISRLEKIQATERRTQREPTNH